MRISDWSSDVCSSDLLLARRIEERDGQALTSRHRVIGSARKELQRYVACAYRFYAMFVLRIGDALADAGDPCTLKAWATAFRRSEEHTSELQSLMRISYAVFCWKTTSLTLPPKDNPQPNTTQHN